MILKRCQTKWSQRQEVPQIHIDYPIVLGLIKVKQSESQNAGNDRTNPLKRKNITMQTNRQQAKTITKPLKANAAIPDSVVQQPKKTENRKIYQQNQNRGERKAETIKKEEKLKQNKKCWRKGTLTVERGCQEVKERKEERGRIAQTSMTSL